MATEIDITHNLGKLSIDIRDQMSVKNMDFAVVKTVSALAIGGRAEVQSKMKDHFTIRRPWVVKGIRARTATMREPEAYVYSQDSAVGDGSEKRNFMSRQEEGGIKTPQGRHRIAVPLKGIQPNKGTLVPAILKPKSLLGGGVPVRIKRKGVVTREYFVSLRGFKTLVVDSKKQPGASVVLTKVGSGRFTPAWVLKPQTKVKPTHFLQGPMAAYLDKNALDVLAKNIRDIIFEKRFGVRPD
jgi:hypothetical protein